MIGIIPAAGKGTRAYPYTKKITKGMLKIHQKPLLLNTILIMRDKMGIDEIYIVIGHMSHTIKDYFGDGKDFGVKITYLVNKHLSRGLAYSVLQAKKYVDDYCCVILSDEFYLDTNHDELVATDNREAIVTCMVKEGSREKDIRKNYSVTLSGDRIVELVEKPKHPPNDILGSGTWIMQKKFFDYIENEFHKNPESSGNLIGIIDKANKAGETVRAFKLKGDYININNKDDINQANNLARMKIIKQSKVSLVMLIENNDTVASSIISGYIAENKLFELILVASNPPNQIKTLINSLNFLNVQMIITPPSIKRYGEQLIYGLKKATGDIIVITTNDQSFLPKDIEKLLMYICEADMVIGTRTTRQMIEQGTNMNTLVRLANYFLAKLIELLWYDRQVRLTDVGCVFRALWKDTFLEIQESLKSKGAEFSSEMIVEILQRRMRIIEIPVNYCKNTDEQHIDLPNRRVGLFLGMIKLILKKRFFVYSYKGPF
jgi:UDP-N-acetylglucosamine diphosphorylase / glucose-1-phosphate thymidylyltransferase / UDP-N-acetylgalactosamine diphosphorylase / glucosamine-1-phosphate N-acetyltransferase / galactosamine-1-phosphate N-acetyltransferase